MLPGETDPRYVHLELDLFWAWRGAADPVDLIPADRRPGPAIHVKDLDSGRQFRRPGSGSHRLRPHFRATDAVDEYIVERDDAGSPPRAPEDALDTARVGYQFLRTVRF